MKRSGALLLAIIFSGQTSAFELDMNITKLKLESETFTSLEEKTLVGSIDAPSFRIKTPLSNITLKKDFHFTADLYLDSDWIYLDNDMFEFTYSAPALTGLSKVRESELENFQIYTNDSSLMVEGDYGHFRLSDMRILFQNMDFTCSLDDSILAAPNAIANSCLNGSIISQSKKDSNENTHIEFQTDDITTSLDINYGHIQKNQVELDLTQFFVRSKEFTVGSEKLNLACPKGIYSKDMDPKLVVAKCLERAEVKAPAILFHKNDNTMNGKINIKEFISDGNSLIFNGPEVEFDLKGEKVNFEDLSAFCKLPELGENFDYPQVITSCLEGSFIGLKKLTMNGAEKNVNLEKAELKVNNEKIQIHTPNIEANLGPQSFAVKEIKYECKNTKIREPFDYNQIIENCFEKSSGLINEFSMKDEEKDFSMTRADLDVDENMINLSSPKMTYINLGNSVEVDFLNSKIECNRNNTEELTVENILRGCFDSSKITIPSIDIRHPEIDSKILIKKISIDKRKIVFNSPKGKYTLNEFDNVYKNFNLSCSLNASYDIAKNYDWESVLENCLHSTKIDFDYLVTKYKGDSGLTQFSQKLKSFGVKAMNDVRFNSLSESGDKFELKLKPKLLAFIPVDVTIKGTINYKRESREIVVDIKKSKFFRVMPAKFITRLILKAFVADEKIGVKGDVITIKIPKDEEVKE